MVPDLVLAYEYRTDSELYEALGSVLLGSGPGVSPSDWDRFRRFARGWYDSKAQQLRQRIYDSETHRIWRESAGPGQCLDANTVAEILNQEGESEELAAVLAVLIARDEQAERSHDYDIAMSFAAEQRDYVELTVTAAKALGLQVFYDRDMTHKWWGQNFVREQRRVYGQRALHFVPFISADYLIRQYPLDEFSYAMVVSVERGNDYILPVLVGDVEVPRELLHPHTGFLRAEDNTPSQLALQMKIKVDASKRRKRQTRDFGEIVEEAHRPPGGIPR
jgi:hypothetical protein